MIQSGHFYLFHEFVQGSKIKSFGPVKRFNFESGEKRVSVLGGMIGAPLALMTLENAVASGAKEFLAFGTAGLLKEPTPGVPILFSPAWGIDETSLVLNYGGVAGRTGLNPFEDLRVEEGLVSVNSPYLLNRDKLRDYLENDIAYIDMEMVPLAYLARERGCRLFPLLLISDRIEKDENWLNESGSREFKAGLDQGLSLLKNK